MTYVSPAYLQEIKQSNLIALFNKETSILQIIQNKIATVGTANLKPKNHSTRLKR